MYLREGTATTRCGSFASRGLPLSVSLPEIVQLLLSASALPENSIRVSLPTKPRKSLADSPRKSAFGAGSSATTGSRLSNLARFLCSDGGNELCVLQLAKSVAGHGERSHAIQTVFRLPVLWFKPRYSELDRYPG